MKNEEKIAFNNLTYGLCGALQKGLESGWHKHYEQNDWHASLRIMRDCEDSNELFSVTFRVNDLGAGWETEFYLDDDRHFTLYGDFTTEFDDCHSVGDCFSVLGRNKDRFGKEESSKYFNDILWDLS